MLPSHATQSHRVRVPDGDLLVDTWGNGPPVVFLHGWTLDSRIWRDQQVMASQFHCVAIDRRGFGRSCAPPGLSREHADISTVAEYFSIDRFALVGLSQGATIALDFARQHPHRVTALALLGAPLHGVVATADSVLGRAAPEIPREAWAALVRAGRLADMMAQWRQHPLAQSRAEATPWVDAILADYQGHDQRVDQAPVLISADDIQALPMPVLAMAGVRDSLWRREVAAYIGQHARGGRTNIIADAGHLANVDQPDTVNALLCEFLAQATAKNG